MGRLATGWPCTAARRTGVGARSSVSRAGRRGLPRAVSGCACGPGRRRADSPSVVRGRGTPERALVPPQPLRHPDARHRPHRRGHDPRHARGRRPRDVAGARVCHRHCGNGPPDCGIARPASPARCARSAIQDAGERATVGSRSAARASRAGSHCRRVCAGDGGDWRWSVNRVTGSRRGARVVVHAQRTHCRACSRSR